MIVRAAAAAAPASSRKKERKEIIQVMRGGVMTAVCVCVCVRGLAAAAAQCWQLVAGMEVLSGELIVLSRWSA